jgi:hypothetical protein
MASDSYGKTGLGSLELLNLETNKISSWSEIKRLARLSIKQLYLLGNPIDSIETEDSDFFPKLQVLHLHRTLIKDWMTVHQLNKFPSLKELRLKDVPVFKDGSEGRRSDLIARVSKITVLNGSEITDRRRQDAELYYLDHAFAKRGDPNFEQEHPRYAELVKIHGAPTPIPVHLT